MTFNRATLEATVAKIACGDDKGTAFAVDEWRLLTARHCIAKHFDSGAAIMVEFANLGAPAVPASLLAENSTLDLAVLKLETALTGVAPLPLSAAPLQYDAEWETYGY